MANTWNTRESLLIKAQNQHDQDAWKEFADYYIFFIKYLLNKLGVHRSDQDDLTQDILVKMWVALPTFKLSKKRGRFRAWISTVVHNRVMDHYRKRYRYENKLKGIPNKDINFSQPEIEELIQKEWESYIVETALERLSTVFSGKAIRVFRMSIQNFSPEMIATTLDLKLKSINKLKNRVRSRLLVEINKLRSDLDPFYE